MRKVIVIKRDDGSCGIFYKDLKESKTLEELQLRKDIVPDGCTSRITLESKLPDRTFRNAWTDDNPTDTVDVDMPKARIIHMDRLRIIRDEKLKELDIEQMKGVDVQAQKQALRDLPQNTDLSIATTPEELKAIMPTELL